MSDANVVPAAPPLESVALKKSILPPGTPWYGYLALALIPTMLGGAGAFGINIVSPGDVNDALAAHIESDAAAYAELEDRQEEFGKSMDKIHLNIMLLCKSQKVDCIDN